MTVKAALSAHFCWSYEKNRQVVIVCTKNNIEIIYHVDRLCIKENGHSIRHNNVQTDGWGLSFCMYICLYDVWMLVGKIYIQSNSGMLYSLSLSLSYLFIFVSLSSLSYPPPYLLFISVSTCSLTHQLYFISYFSLSHLTCTDGRQISLKTIVLSILSAFISHRN